MASDIHMPGPVCLIENTNTQLLVNPEALKILSAITQPIVVVAIVGLYRTGKSYLMNKLAGKKNGFSLGSMVQSHTKGIRMWCVRHPKKPNYTLVLLDTKGLGDVEKGDNQNDSWIFALAILLSSTFVYNSMGTINQQAIDELHYVTELTDKIRAKSSPDANEVEDSADFVSFFPDFVWTLRDFSLELEADGQPISADEYLQNSLKLKQGTSLKNEKFNLPRLCIRKFFPKKKCFVFDRPTHRKKLGQLETMHDDELDPNSCNKLLTSVPTSLAIPKSKLFQEASKSMDPRLETLVMTYVNAISSRDLPCMENAILALAQIENSAAVQKAIAHYDQQMSEKVQLPTETLQELLDLHMASEKEAIEVFMKNSFKDVDHLFKNKLATVNELKKKYLQEPRKGIQSEEVLHTYLRSKESVIDAILQKDQNLTKREKLIEVQRMKAESAEAAAKMLEEMQKKNQQMMEEEEKIYQEYVKQLAEKMEQERAQLMAEQERALSLKLQEQAMLQKEGFQDESRQLQREIENLKNNMARSRKKCILI